MSKVFISYTHDSPAHRDQVLALSERLRTDGIETLLDQYVNGSPPEGWPRWMLDQLDAADYVLVICTETYHRRFRGREQPGKGKGANWEGALITQEIYDSSSRTGKFVPVFLATPVEAWIPEPLRSRTFYALTSQAAYENLYDYLLSQSGVEPAKLGTPRRKARRKGTPLTFQDAAPASPQGPPADLADLAADCEEPTEPVTRRQKSGPPPLPPVRPATLLEILVGRWQVQIQVPFAPGVMGQLNLDLFPNGMFRGQLLNPAGVTAIEGRWQANPIQNQIALQGAQTNGFQMIPYAVMVQVTSFDARQILGVTSGGEQVHWQRMNPPNTPPPMAPF
jgi:hypothetical protein